MLSNSPFGTLIQEAFNPEQLRHFVNVLDIGDDALLARIHLARAAQKSIDIQTYLWMNDETGRYLLYELLQAAKRGVRVRILLDHWVMGLSTDQDAALAAFVATVHPNLYVKVYNPPDRLHPRTMEALWRAAVSFKELNQRMHNKVFLVDECAGITGGRNYQNDYYDRGGRRNFKDRDVLAVGPVAGQMSASFELFWNYDRSIPAADLLDVANVIDSGTIPDLRNREDFIGEDEFADLDAVLSDSEEIRQRLVDSGFRARHVQFVADQPGKNFAKDLTGGSLTAFELVKFLSQARRRILIQSPYLVLDQMAVNAAAELKQSNPNLDISVSTNSLAATDNLYAYAFAHKQRRQFLRDLRMRIFEFRPVPRDIASLMPRYTLLQQNLERTRAQNGEEREYCKENQFEYPDVHMCIHAKTYLVDDDMVWIGSYNLDPRSANLNTECALIISDPAVNEAVSQSIQRDIAPANSWTIGRRKHLPIRNYFSRIIGAIIQRTQRLKLWPFQYTESFELKQGRQVVPWYDDDFYENFVPAGPFPEVPANTREIEISLVQAFGGFLKPMI